ncbi:hypothetical protein BDK51DRAFT_45857 [Blyttiomyces helicus]|uniref:Uncharacterized protein n=1 Tax=Blyttiomyces helicus TaxID=388810 RepID=A0A4P9WL44_9FUNG|nr:hypothetical protein BDK51DRAFT_45857 [Blyttiomyces helicus]|eukprot:RKO91910.1 hypothetical protein BDK51DRAFT_45857 [Blyttiomyces helicus]
MSAFLRKRALSSSSFLQTKTSPSLPACPRATSPFFSTPLCASDQLVPPIITTMVGPSGTVRGESTRQAPTAALDEDRLCVGGSLSARQRWRGTRHDSGSGAFGFGARPVPGPGKGGSGLGGSRRSVTGSAEEAVAAHDAFLNRLGSKLSAISRDGSIVSLLPTRPPNPNSTTIAPAIAPTGAARSRFKSSRHIILQRPKIKMPNRRPKPLMQRVNAPVEDAPVPGAGDARGSLEADAMSDGEVDVESSTILNRSATPALTSQNHAPPPTAPTVAAAAEPDPEVQPPKTGTQSPLRASDPTDAAPIAFDPASTLITDNAVRSVSAAAEPSHHRPVSQPINATLVTSLSQCSSWTVATMMGLSRIIEKSFWDADEGGERVDQAPSRRSSLGSRDANSIPRRESLIGSRESRTAPFDSGKRRDDPRAPSLDPDDYDMPGSFVPSLVRLPVLTPTTARLPSPHPIPSPSSTPTMRTLRIHSQLRPHHGKEARTHRARQSSSSQVAHYPKYNSQQEQQQNQQHQQQQPLRAKNAERAGGESTACIPEMYRSYPQIMGTPIGAPTQSPPSPSPTTVAPLSAIPPPPLLTSQDLAPLLSTSPTLPTPGPISIPSKTIIFTAPDPRPSGRRPMVPVARPPSSLDDHPAVSVSLPRIVDTKAQRAGSAMLEKGAGKGFVRFDAMRLGGLGPEKDGEEYLARLEKHQKQRYYGAQVRALAMSSLRRAIRVSSSPQLGNSLPPSFDANSTARPASTVPADDDAAPTLERRPPLVVGRHASLEEVEEATAKRERAIPANGHSIWAEHEISHYAPLFLILQMRIYAASIKRPTTFVPSSPLATPSTPATILVPSEAPPTAAATTLRELEAEHARDVAAVESIRRELGL